MNDEIIQMIFRDLLMLGLVITGPILILTFVAAVLIGIIQSMMQIQEQTLSFAPKMFLVAIILMLLTPSIFDRLVTGIQEAMKLAQKMF
jgi:flagellar biosynthetic protein FliQ